MPNISEQVLTRTRLSSAVLLGAAAGSILIAFAAATYTYNTAQLKKALKPSIKNCITYTRSVTCTVALQNTGKKAIKKVKVQLYAGKAKTKKSQTLLTTSPASVPILPAKKTVEKRINFPKPANWSGTQTVFAKVTVGGKSVTGGELGVNADQGNTQQTVSTISSAPDANAWVTDGFVYEMATGSDGIVYIGGKFTKVGPADGGNWQSRSNLAAIDPMTGQATEWNPGVNSAVSAFAISGHTLYVGGSFTSIGGKSRNYIAALDTTANTNNATDWNPNASGSQGPAVTALTLSGTTLYVGGNFDSIGGQRRIRLAALDTTVNTNNATAFDPEANDLVYSLALSGTTLYVGGNFTSIGGRPRNRLAALNTTANINNATDWNPNPSGPGSGVNTLTLFGTTLYAGGNFTSISGQSRRNLVSFDLASGNLTAWNPDPDAWVESSILFGTTLYVGGAFSTIGGQKRSRIAALDTVANTNNATDWNPVANDFIHAFAFSGTTLYAGGRFTTVGSDTKRQHLAVFRNANTSNQPVTYTFDSADELKQFTTAGQGTWTVGDGVLHAAPGTGHSYLFSKATYGDVEVRADVLYSGLRPESGLVVRAKGGSNLYLFDTMTVGCGDKPGLVAAVDRWVDLACSDKISAPLSNTWYTLKLQAIGTTLKAKLWKRGEAEPDWQVTATESSFISGAVGLDAINAEGAADFDNLTITPLGATTNRPPVISPIADQTVVAGTKLSFDVIIDDPDGDKLGIGQTGFSESACSFNSKTPPVVDTCIFTPTLADVGSHSQIIWVIDSKNPKVDRTVKITVVAPAPATIYRFDSASEADAWDTKGAWKVENGVLAQKVYEERYLYQKNTDYYDVSLQTDLLMVDDIPGTVARSGGYDCMLSPSFLRIYKSSHAQSIGSKDKTSILGLWYTMKFQVKGNTISCKVWERGTTEPAAWTLTAKDDGYSHGSIGLIEEMSLSLEKQYDNVIIRPLKTTTGNRYPSFLPYAHQSVVAGQPLSVTLSATDADSDALFLRAYNQGDSTDLPAGASFADNGNGTGTLTWAPTAAQAGSYSFTVEAYDGQVKYATSLLVRVFTEDANRPVLRPVLNMTASVGSTSVFTVAATDPNAKRLTLSTDVLAPGASFADNGNGTGTLTWAPTEKSSTISLITITATNGTQSVAQNVSLVRQ